VTHLTAADVHRPCREAEIPFETTAAAGDTDALVGQDRAIEALRFGIGIRQHGFHLFAIGEPGVGKRSVITRFLDAHARTQPTPSDWCYVHDFSGNGKPLALELPAGMGPQLEQDMVQVVAELQVAMRQAFDSEEYRTRKQQLVLRAKERQDHALDEVRRRAQGRDVAVTHTDTGVAVAPLRGGAILDPETFRSLPEAEQDRYRAAMEKVGEELQALLRQFHEWGHADHDEAKALEREIAAATVRRVLDTIRPRYAALPAVMAHLERVERDATDNAGDLLEGGAEGIEAALRRALKREQADGSSLRRYGVNVLVDRGDRDGAPVVYEDHPTLDQLVGRIEHETQFGALLTNFTLIKAGALHRALGGYLVVDAIKLLQQPLAWEALKRTIRSGRIRIESLGHALGLVSTVSLEPEPLPVGDTKIVLVGARRLYYLLAALDPDFLDMFKVLVDFDDDLTRDAGAEARFAGLIASLVRSEDLRPFDRGAVARVIGHASRAAGDAGKLSLHLRSIVDLLREADYWAGEAGRETATAADVQAAIDAGRRRAGRVRERLQEAVRRDDIRIATEGERVGEVNGLSVLQLGEHVVGHPTRITARVRLGKGEVVDIEREVGLGGPIHSKGVLILGGFLGARYAPGVPLSLGATLVFEQSYGAVEGDSASMAELCALLSALAEVPVRQDLAMTGSVDQLGRAQSIGAVNDKIEGFFDVCRDRGLTGDQGVLIPRSNVKNLMLRADVVEAVEAGTFHIHAIDTVDDALELLSGQPAGARDTGGAFPMGSVNARIDARLAGFAEAARAFLSRRAQD